MLDKLDGRAPQQDGVQPLPPVTEISPPKPGEGNGAAAKEKKDGDDSTNDGDSTAAGEGNGASAAASMSNTIGQLQELCVHRGLPMPIYDLAAVDGQPHMREFAMTVRVGSLASKGEGTSKKDAKRDAALKMVAQIKALVGEGKEIAAVSGKDAEKEEELSKEDKELAKKVEGMKIDPLTKKHSMKIQQFYRNMQDTAGSKLFLLHRTSLKSAQVAFQFYKPSIIMIHQPIHSFLTGPQLRAAARRLGRRAEVRGDARRDRGEDGRGRDAVSRAALLPARHRLLRHWQGHGLRQSGANEGDTRTSLIPWRELSLMLLSLTGRGQERPQLSEDDDEEVRGRDRSQQRRRGRKQQRKVNGGGEVEA